MASYLPALSYFISYKSTILYPISLLVAGTITYYELRDNPKIKYREMAAFVITLGVIWGLQTLRISSIAVSSHVLALMFAFFAYNRQKYNQLQKSNEYIWLVLLFTLLPVAFEALANTAGGIYGWWLILESVLFMFIGKLIKRRFVTLVGLASAVLAVIYQLRHLSWAALTILALFIIGSTVYKSAKK